MADPLNNRRRAAYAVAAFFSVLMVMNMLRGSKTSTGGQPSPLPGKGGEPAFERTIVAVGDLHGDYPNMMTVLKMAKVVSANGTWTGNVDYLVQTGDIVDRGDDTLKMYRYLENLRVEAQKAGGDVRSHFGNHEVMNLIGASETRIYVACS
ncbi:hypothetical protein FRC00_006617 [Tulasnella sp. 408]|nr:hypothetical protein FRC00_006617 [Tulasnella sp. 408]